MKALTLWQPMAHAVAIGMKTLENRPWMPPQSIIGERIAIHAGKKWCEEHALWIHEKFDLEIKKHNVVFGAVIATAVVEGATSVQDSLLDANDQRWWMGPCGWLLREIVPTAPIPCRGYQKLWNLPEDVERQIEARP